MTREEAFAMLRLIAQLAARVLEEPEAVAEPAAPNNGQGAVSQVAAHP